MSVPRQVLDLLESVQKMVTHLDKVEPERLERTGMIELVQRMCALEALVADKKAALSDPGADAPGQAQSGASETSKAAQYAVMPRSGTHRAKVLDALAEAYKDPGRDGRHGGGLTYDELVEATGLGTYDRVGPRLRELREGGWVEDSGTRRGSDLDQDSIVWVISAVGAERLADLAEAG